MASPIVDTITLQAIHDRVQNLTQRLERSCHRKSGLIFYTPGGEPVEVTYVELYRDAAEKASLLRGIPELSTWSIVLLHFDTQRGAITWFWAVTLAGLIPCMSTPLPHNEAKREKHIRHLQQLLNSPVILTSENLVVDFSRVEGLAVYSTASLSNGIDSSRGEPVFPLPGQSKTAKKTALLMLTSGSTGNAKAVPLRHGQILASLRGKQAHFGYRRSDVFLNWIGMDHVASMVEIHLLAVSLGSVQVHVSASELSDDPLRLIDLLATHRRIISGGESNVVATCEVLTRQLQQRCGVKGEIICPGFGMTETCAGSIYAFGFPSLDMKRGLEFGRLGSCIPGLQMRILKNGGEAATCGEVGELQLKGPVVLTGYFNNSMATAEAFTDDGWFITGDLAWLDDSGSMNIAGRTKDTIIINGNNWSATEIETSVEEEGIPGVTPSYTVVFPCRDPGSATEGIAVVFCPTYRDDEAGLAVQFETHHSIAKTIALHTAQKPDHILPLPASMLEKSSLGKISRTKVRAAFENCVYAVAEENHLARVATYQKANQRECVTKTECMLQGLLSSMLNIPKEEITANSSIFELGVSLFDLIALKAKIAVDTPMATLMTQPAVAAIASAIDTILSNPAAPDYNPIVPLQTQGTQTPIFLLHPATGDVLAFVALAKHFLNRPMYALRARGFNRNEPLFILMRETVETYTTHIRRAQPRGPYALAGYSLGCTLAFEIGKLLEEQGQEVRFLACIDSPPDMRKFARGRDRYGVVVAIAFFFDLVDEETRGVMLDYLQAKQAEGTPLPRDEALAYVLSFCDAERVRGLSLDTQSLGLISDMYENFRVHGLDYTPSGSVDHIDIFVADSPDYAGVGRSEWKEMELGQWEDFARSDVEFYDVPGIHQRVLDPELVPGFVRQFKIAMKRRGL
ncbi:hypothetical protein BDW74DRAFT_167743 [Aspergillus multicolor]|uniref:non-ribosomal peptide synthetase n=1 Tax=Aspergillus multicolor TaxID=41759 RepID=UPI003CCD2C1A